MVGFINDHRDQYGVEPICAVLPIAPSTYFRVRAQQQDEQNRSARAKRDDELRVLIRRVYEESFGGVYGPRKVWKQLRRANEILRKASAYFAQAELDRRSK